MNIPQGYLPVMPYLILRDGQAFMSFMKKVFNASEQHIMKAEDGSIQHGQLKIGDAVIMFGEATGTWAEKPAGMFIYIESADKIFDLALKNEAIPLMPPSQQPYGRSAGFEDPFGNHWWVTEP